MLKQMLTLLDFGSKKQNLLLSIFTIAMYQNCSISIFSFFCWVGGKGGNQLINGPINGLCYEWANNTIFVTGL